MQVVRLESFTYLIPGMTKVYPNIAAAASTTANEKLKASAALEADEVVLTVWKKSLLFNCNGFTVFDGKGNLLFRVDNYMAASGSNGEIVLMDATGKPLLTIRRKVCLELEAFNLLVLLLDNYTFAYEIILTIY